MSGSIISFYPRIRSIIEILICWCDVLRTLSFRYYMCRTSNVLQTQQVTIHVTLDCDFMVDVRNYSILTGFIVSALFTLATLIGKLNSEVSYGFCQ